jgi:iron(III) transport system substrate-binding protein
MNARLFVKWGSAFLCGGLFVACCSRQSGAAGRVHQEVVVYSSVDDDCARPLSERFSRATGVEVKLVPDTEETKSTGLLNRLIAEKSRPQADVFWSGDPVRAAVLAHRGICAPYRSPAAEGLNAGNVRQEENFTVFSARMRVVIFNQDRLLGKNPPSSIFDLADARFRGRACIANPLFGTTSMHVAALFQVLGPDRARTFFDQLIQNQVKMLSSNGEVRRRVTAGDFDIGLTDSDDANVALKDGAHIGFVLPDQDGIGTLLVPNAAVLIAGGPNPENGRRFIDFLLSAESERWLAESDAAQMPLRDGIVPPKFFGRPISEIRLMRVEYAPMAAQLEELAGGFLEEWVHRQEGLAVSSSNR